MLDELLKIKSNIELYKDKLKNERVTKYSLIEPFFRVLGYEISNPYDIETEFICSLNHDGKDKGRVDYALMKDEKPFMIVEAKSYSRTLPSSVIPQLKEYFEVVDVDIALATNGRHYWFFNGEPTNKRIMNEEPFYKLDIMNISYTDLGVLTLLHRNNISSLHLDSVLYSSSIKPLLYKFIKDNLLIKDSELNKFLSKHKTTNYLDKDSILSLLNLDLQSDIILESTKITNTPDTNNLVIQNFRRLELLGLSSSTDILGKDTVIPPTRSIRLNKNSLVSLLKYVFDSELTVEVNTRDYADFMNLGFKKLAEKCETIIEKEKYEELINTKLDECFTQEAIEYFIRKCKLDIEKILAPRITQLKHTSTKTLSNPVGIISFETIESYLKNTGIDDDEIDLWK